MSGRLPSPAEEPGSGETREKTVVSSSTASGTTARRARTLKLGGGICSPYPHLDPQLGVYVRTALMHAPLAHLTKRQGGHWPICPSVKVGHWTIGGHINLILVRADTP